MEDYEVMEADDTRSFLLEENIVMKRNLNLEGDFIHDAVQIKNGSLFFNDARSLQTKSKVVTEDNAIFATVDYLSQKVNNNDLKLDPPKVTIKENDEKIVLLDKKLNSIHIDDLVSFLSGSKLSDMILKMDQRVSGLENAMENTLKNSGKTPIIASSANLKNNDTAKLSNIIEIELLRKELKSYQEKTALLEARINDLENPEKIVRASEVFANKIHF